MSSINFIDSKFQPKPKPKPLTASKGTNGAHVIADLKHTIATAWFNKSIPGKPRNPEIPGSTVVLFRENLGLDSQGYNCVNGFSYTTKTNSHGQVAINFTGSKRPTTCKQITEIVSSIINGPKGKDEAPAPSGAGHASSGAGPAPSGAGPALSVAGPAPSGNAWEKPEKPPTFTDDQQKEIENAEQKRNTAVTDTTSLEKKVSDLEKALSDAKKELESAKRKEKIHNDVLSTMRESFICQNELASLESIPSKDTPVNAEEPSDLTAAEVAKQMGWSVAKKNK